MYFPRSYFLNSLKKKDQTMLKHFRVLFSCLGSLMQVKPFHFINIIITVLIWRRNKNSTIYPSSMENTGILDTVVSFLSLITVMLKTVLYEGSSQHGNTFLASIGSKFVTAMYLKFQHYRIYLYKISPFPQHYCNSSNNL